MKNLYMLVLLCMFQLFCYAGGTSTLFSEIDIGKGARAAAMGMANTSLSDDSSGIYWNPAGLGNIKENQISFSYNKWFLDASLKSAEAALKIGRGSLGLGFIYVDMGEFDYIDSSGILTGKTIRPFTMAMTAGYSAQALTYYEDFEARRPVFKVLTGVSFKFVHNNDGYEDLGALLADAGAMLMFADIVDIGVSFKTLQLATQEDIASSVNLGVSKTILNDSINKLTISSDLHAWMNNNQEICAGIEYSMSDYLFLRAGYVYVPGFMTTEGYINGINGGMGLKIENFRLDYAFTTHGGLGTNHSATVIFYPQFN